MPRSFDYLLVYLICILYRYLYWVLSIEEHKNGVYVSPSLLPGSLKQIK
jgi:hypothetical protein